MTDSGKQKLNTADPTEMQKVLRNITGTTEESAPLTKEPSFNTEDPVADYDCPFCLISVPKFWQLKEHMDKAHNRRVDTMTDVNAWKSVDKKIQQGLEEVRSSKLGFEFEPNVLQEEQPPPSEQELFAFTVPSHYDGVPVASADFQKGVKYDQGKPDFSLLPEDALWKLAEHYTKGAEKYEARNWEKGIAYSRLYSASRRHMVAWFLGEEADEEGFAHLPAAIFGLLDILAFELRGMGPDFDDRPTIESDYR